MGWDPGVQFLGNGILALVQPGALLFIVGFAQIAADQGVVGVQAGGNLDVPAALVQMALPDLGQPQTQPRQGSPDPAQWLFKGLLGLLRLDLRQVGETQHGLGPGEIGLQAPPSVPL